MRARSAILGVLAAIASACSLQIDVNEGYACDGALQCADGYRCIQSVCTVSGPVCGDYVVDPGEECDDGNTVLDTCWYTLTSCTACSPTCTVVAGLPNYCGDGNLDAGYGELCDAGGANSDAADADCRTDCTPRRCGDGVVDAGEGCDSGALNVASCAYGPTQPPPGGFCTVACTPCAGTIPYCGDGGVDSGFGEACDLAAVNGVCGLGAAPAPGCWRDCTAWTCDREWTWWKPLGDALPDTLYDTATAGVVKDLVTGLTWQRTSTVASYTWDAAGTYCATLSLASLSGWRLPTFTELQSIVDYSKSAPAINTNAFLGTEAAPYWASTKWAFNASAQAWTVSFDDGTAADALPFASTALVRCVR